VELLTFGPNVGRSIDAHGSDFVIAGLAEVGGPARAACIHLPPGGSVGAHPTTSSQLFCVVAGSGWVIGGDGRRQNIRAFEAAHWTAGEVHAVGTDEGLVAVVLEGPTVAPPRR
jgi:hypothetical protein